MTADLDDWPADLPRECKARTSLWGCCEPSGHAGDHVARTTHEVARWPVRAADYTDPAGFGGETRQTMGASVEVLTTRLLRFLEVNRAANRDAGFPEVGPAAIDMAGRVEALVELVSVAAPGAWDPRGRLARARPRVGDDGRPMTDIAREHNLVRASRDLIVAWDAVVKDGGGFLGLWRRLEALKVALSFYDGRFATLPHGNEDP